jgi:O-antigen/teichoic acid export membrane protein
MRNKVKALGGLLVSVTARNTYAVFAGNRASAFFSFIFTVLLVRYLSLSDFGNFSALLSLILIVTEIADLGIGQSLSSFFESGKYKE